MNQAPSASFKVRSKAFQAVSTDVLAHGTAYKAPLTAFKTLSTAFTLTAFQALSNHNRPDLLSLTGVPRS